MDCFNSEHFEFILTKWLFLLSHSGGNGESDFTLVGNVGQQAGNGAGIAQVIRVNNRIFDMLSGQAEIDHPLCEV